METIGDGSQAGVRAAGVAAILDRAREERPDAWASAPPGI
jgi:hypothetical protein